MTHTLSSIIGLTNAPAPPHWFEFLLEPGRLQQHLETSGCDPSPIQLITLFFRNIPNIETTTTTTPTPKYYIKKTYALQTLAIKVASFLKWDLDLLCRGLTIPIQCKLMQALLMACSPESCPPEVKKFASVTHNHWFLRSAIAYKLSTLVPQSNGTTIIYLSQLQQEQQAADTLALLSMGELFSESSKMLEKCSNELHSYIMELSESKDNSGKKFKSSNHPFKKAKLTRPMMDCFDSRDEQFNDWSQCELIDPLEFIEAACYDLGRFFFFEESYTLAKQSFEIIKSSAPRFPLLEQYLESATSILTPDDKPLVDDNDNDDDDMCLSEEQNYCDRLTSDINERRKQTEKYLFDCMNQYSKEKRDADDEDDTTNENGNDKLEVGIMDETDLRYEQQMIQQKLPENSAWYLQVPAKCDEQRLLELAKGDLFMSRGNFKQAMGCFVGALMIVSDYFREFSKNYIDEEPYISRMIQCSVSLNCFTQAVALCQMTKSLNYTIAFKQLNERVCNDCCDDIYECIWNVTLLEYIINLHARRGEVDRRTKVISLIGQLELNENNPEEILREAEHVRRGRFFRIMSNKYL